MDGWCHHCNSHHIPSRPDAKGFRYDVNCPKLERNKPFILPVLMIGNAGTGVGSRIKGHSRRGGGKMRAEHRRYCTVGMTDEYRSSKTCVYCSHQVRQARARRVDRINKTIKTVTVNGTVECVNPNCISFTCGYTIKSRDPHAAVGIAIAGASPHFEPNRAVLAPYTRGFQPITTTTNNASPAAGTPPLLTSAASLSSSDATGAPMSTMGLSSSPGGG